MNKQALKEVAYFWLIMLGIVGYCLLVGWASANISSYFGLVGASLPILIIASLGIYYISDAHNKGEN